jgi:hypothetical protein
MNITYENTYIYKVEGTDNLTSIVEKFKNGIEANDKNIGYLNAPYYFHSGLEGAIIKCAADLKPDDVWKRKRNKEDGYIGYKKKNMVDGARYKKNDDINWIYAGELVEIPITITFRNAKFKIKLKGRKKKYLIVFLHGMSAKDRKVNNKNGSDYIYPEVYWSHPNHDACTYVQDNEFWLKVLPDELAKEVTSENRKIVNLYTKQTHKEKVRYAFYSMQDADPKEDYKKGCDIVLPEYNGDFGFFIGSLEVFEMLNELLYDKYLSKYNYKQIIIVAHSMGGLVTRGILSALNIEDLAFCMNLRYDYYVYAWGYLVNLKRDVFAREAEIELDRELGRSYGKYGLDSFKKRDQYKTMLDVRIEQRVAYENNKLLECDFDKILELSGHKNKDVFILPDGGKVDPYSRNNWFIYSKDELKSMTHQLQEFRSKLTDKLELFITLGSPHEGTNVSDSKIPYGSDNKDAAFHMRTRYIKQINDNYMKPEDIFKNCSKLNKFIVLGGRIQYGSPMYLPLRMKGNEMSADQDFWRSHEEGYDKIKQGDLNFFNQAGCSSMFLDYHSWNYIEDLSTYFRDVTTDEITVTDPGWVPLIPQPDLPNYTLDNDAALRLDSALFYHYWEKMKTDKFPDPRNKEEPQTFVLTHADLKAPVIIDEINSNNKKEEKIGEEIKERENKIEQMELELKKLEGDAKKIHEEADSLSSNNHNTIDADSDSRDAIDRDNKQLEADNKRLEAYQLDNKVETKKRELNNAKKNLEKAKQNRENLNKHWETRMKNKILSDNNKLIDFIKIQIGGIK